MLVLLQKQISPGSQRWYLPKLFFFLIFPVKGNYFNWHLSQNRIRIISVLKIWKKHFPSVSITQLANYIAKNNLPETERPFFVEKCLLLYLTLYTDWWAIYRRYMILTYAVSLSDELESKKNLRILVNNWHCFKNRGWSLLVRLHYSREVAYINISHILLLKCSALEYEWIGLKRRR